jgi:flagellin
VENLTAAQSRLSDVDVAEVFSRMTKAQVMEQFQISVLAQANAAPNYVLRLL